MSITVNDYDYNYHEAIRDDVRRAIEDDYLDLFSVNNEDEDAMFDFDEDSVAEKISDALWTDDSVTGNGSGSYTFSTYRAEVYLAHNWDLLQEVLEEFSEPLGMALEKGPEWCDVSIRCFLLYGAVADIVHEIAVEKGLIM